MRAFFLALFGSLALATSPAAQEFPPFPVLQEMDYPQEIEAIEARAAAGEGYATLLIASRTDCSSNDEGCWARLSDMYRDAALKGQSAAMAMLRVRVVQADPSRAAEFSIGSTVCERSRAEAPRIVREITSIELLNHDGESGEWSFQEGRGSLGSEVISVSRGAVGAILVFSGDSLRLVRVFTNFLSIGSREGNFESVQLANAVIAQAVCPMWSGLSEAIPGYILGVAQSWPPQAVHVDGPTTRFAATGVTPDIFWFDLYVDPQHNPFTSGGFDEQFQPATGLGLAPAD